MHRIQHALRPLALSLSILAVSCASDDGVTTRAGQWAEVPEFRAGDPRVDTPGFVRQTLRLELERNEVTYTLMAFVVGDTLTLGAMTDSEFQGVVTWRVGPHELWLPFDTTEPSRTAGVVLDGLPNPDYTGTGASFRGITWVNVELPANWIKDGMPLQLTFAPEVGVPVALPDAAHHYRARYVEG